MKMDAFQRVTRSSIVMLLAGLCGTAALALRPTPTRTRFPCPTATAQPMWVEPVTSPTDELSQVVVVRIGYGSRVEVETESGTFVTTGSFDTGSQPAEVTVQLLPDTVHHLTVRGTVRPAVDGAGCMFGGYTLTATSDRYGGSLVIVQGPGDGATPTATETPTPSPTPSQLPGRCIGDANNNGLVTIDELLLAVNILLGQQPLTDYPSLDEDHSNKVEVNEVIRAVRSALSGC